jgi:hypothetical protein
MSLFSKTSPFSPDMPGPPPPPVRGVGRIARPTDLPPRNSAVIAHEELESWYAILNDLYSTRTSARIPEPVGEALADLRDSIYRYLH